MVCLTFFAAMEAAAAVVVTDAPSFLSGVNPGAYLEDFEGYTVGNKGSPVSFSGGSEPFAYDVTASGGVYIANGSAHAHSLSTNNYNTTLTLTFTSGNVSAIGGNFFIASVSGAPRAGSITATVNDGSFVTLTSVTSGSQPYAGFTTSIGAPITSLTLTISDPAGFVMVDNLTVGAVPESAFLGLPLGLFVLAGALRRRR